MYGWSDLICVVKVHVHWNTELKWKVCGSAVHVLCSSTGGDSHAEC